MRSSSHFGSACRKRRIGSRAARRCSAWSANISAFRVSEPMNPRRAPAADDRAARRRRPHDRASRRRHRVRVRRDPRRSRRRRDRKGAARHGVGGDARGRSSDRPIASTARRTARAAARYSRTSPTSGNGSSRARSSTMRSGASGASRSNRPWRWPPRRSTAIACARGCTCATDASGSFVKARIRCATPRRRASCATTRSR